MVFSLCRGVGLTALTVFFMRVRIEGLSAANVVSGFAIAGYGDVAAKVSIAATFCALTDGSRNRQIPVYDD